MQWFKKFLMFLGAIFLAILLGVGALYAWSAGLDKSSRVFAEQSVKAMFGKWDYEALKSRAEPLMFANSTEEGFRGAFDHISRLGTLKALHGCQGAAAINLGFNGFSINARYNCRMEFDNDTASIVFLLVRGESNLWRIGGMHVESDYLANLENRT